MSLADGQWWNSTALIGWVTIFATIVGLPVSVLLFRWGRRPEPRSELVWQLSVVKLLAENLDYQMARNLEITYGDETLNDPHLASLLVVSRSQKDIASDRFDAEKPLIFNLGVPIVAAVGSPSGSAVAENYLTLEKNAGLVKIAPHLIRSGHVLFVELLTDRPPVLRVDRNPLKDAVIHQWGVNDRLTVRARRRARFPLGSPWSTAVAGAVVAAAIIATILSQIPSSHSSEGGSPQAPRVAVPVEQDGDFAFQFTGISCGQAAAQTVYNDPDFPGNLPAGSEECIANLRIADNGNEAQSYSDTNQYAYDARGRQFSADTNDENLVEPDAQINPGLSITAQVAFNIPAGDTLVRLELHDTSFSQGVIVRI